MPTDPYEALAEALVPARARPRAQGATPDPFERTEQRQGLTYEQAAALVADLERIEKRAKAGLDRIEAGGALTGISALRKVYNDARDTRAWAERHLDDANPRMLHVEPLP